MPTFQNNLARTGSYSGRGPKALSRLVWKFKAEDWIVSSPTIVDGAVYFGSLDGYFYAVDSSTGQERWRFKTEDWIVSSPTIVDGVVYFGSLDGYFYAVDSSTGQERWRFKTEDGIASSPAIADGVVYFSSDDGNLYAVDQHSGQFLIANGRMRVSDLFHSDLVNEKSRVSALTQKSVRTIGRYYYQPRALAVYSGGREPLLTSSC